MVRTKVLPVSAAAKSAEAVERHPVSGSQQELDGRPTRRPSLVAREPTRFLLFLDDKLFVCCWWLVLLLHACDVAFLVSTTCLYYWLLHNEYARFNLLYLVTLEISYDTLDTMNYGFAVVAVMHGLALLRMVYYSVKARKLVFSKVSLRSMFSTMTTRSLHTQRSRLSLVGDGADTRRTTKAQRIYHKWIETWLIPTFSINGKRFDDFFLIQEYLEVIAQVYQARRMSMFIATRWVNNLFVFMIVLNCFSTPLVHLLVPEHKVSTARRVLEVTISSFLDFINSVLIPFVIFSKTLTAYDPAIFTFKKEYSYDDVWWAKALRENQQLLVTSTYDYLSTLWPHINLLNCLMICESLLRRRRPSDPLKPTKPAMDSQVSVVPNPSEFNFRTKSTWISLNPLNKPSPKGWRVGSLMRILAYNLLWISGVVVLGVHIDAQSVSETMGCKLIATPWFSGRKSSCVVMNVNCYRRGIEGKEADLQTLLAPLNPKTMATLIFTHCSGLEIPPAIQQFAMLDGIEIYNCTLAQWPVESAPRTRHLSLSYIFIVRSNVTSAFPKGLLQPDFPPNEMYFYDTNLTTLPFEIKDTWINVNTIMLEFNKHLDEIPRVVFEMPQLESLALTGDAALYEINENLFVNAKLLALRLSGSSLVHLPMQSSANLSQMFRLALEYTLLDEIPGYIRDWYLANSDWVDHSLYGSPYCTKTLNESHEPQEKIYQDQVCAKDHGTVAGYYPIDIVAPQRLP